ncbi:hypothetical protein GGX14DRAFT_676218, partial [Mycena pura]
VALFLSTYAALCAVYPVLARFVKTTRQAAWILPTVVSVAMTAASLAFVRDYLRSGGDVTQVQPRQPLAVAVNRFFQVQTLSSSDLTVGAICYRSQMNFLTGWVHHVAYVGVNEIAIRQGCAHIFCLAAFMELPTFLLGLGTVVPRLRSDRLFAIVFFLTRIVFHILLIGAYARAAPGGSHVPSALLLTAFPLHALWFANFVRGYLRRAAAIPARYPLTPDVHPDARSLARHAAALGASVPPSDVTLRA